MKRLIVVAICLVIAAAAYFYTVSPDANGSQDAGQPLADGALVAISLPAALSEQAQIGKIGFEANCASCHGLNAVGKDGVAPPLVHKIYEPSHHGDEAFQRAVALGVQGHHWPFGNMAPVDGLTRSDVAMIVAYIRELQQANGIN